MGLAPLADQSNAASDNPRWVRWFLNWVKAHGRRFYDFDGLTAFKAKFRPHGWEPIYAVANERSFSFRTLYSIAAAFSGRSPVALLLSGLMRAAKQELAWMCGTKER
jgi:phosphatidylglycerol lysyltransferase